MNRPPRVTRKVEITLGGTSINVGELLDILGEFPRDAVLRVDYSRGDPHDPREYDVATFRIQPKSLGL